MKNDFFLFHAAVKLFYFIMNDDYYRIAVFLWTSYVNWSIIIDVYNRQPSWIAKISMETEKIILFDLLCFNPICATCIYLRMQ